MHDNSSDALRPRRRVVDPRRSPIAPDRLPEIMQQKEAEAARLAEARMQRLRREFESRTAAPAPQPTIDDAAPPPAEQPPAPEVESTRPRTAKRGKVKRRKEYLEPKQHARLRDQIEHLWAVDKRFRNWSLLAKAAGLSSGQAVKRAYEVNSSMATLRNIDTFARLHAGFGSKATRALNSGVPISRLQAHLMGNTDAADGGVSSGEGDDEGPQQRASRKASTTSASRGPGRSAKQAPHEPDFTMDQLGETPPSTDFGALVDAGRAIDAEVKRLWLIARFFEQMSGSSELPWAVRNSAATARHHVLRAVAQFAPADAAAASVDVATTDSAPAGRGESAADGEPGSGARPEPTLSPATS